MTPYIDKTDDQIQQDVMAELRWDSRLRASEIGVQVDRGVVTLTGVVSSYAERAAAEEGAHRVLGVLDVADDIRVDVPGRLQRSDSDIARAVRHALEWDVYIPEDRIKTTVSDGILTLEGRLDHWSQREDAERAVRNLAGVRGVINRLSIEPESALARQVQGTIREALMRHADRAARHVDVHIQDGRITLIGRVRSWADRRVLVGAVIGMPGVHAVDVHIRVDPAL